MLTNTAKTSPETIRRILLDIPFKWVERTYLLEKLHPNDIILATAEEWLVVDVTGKHIINKLALRFPL